MNKKENIQSLKEVNPDSQLQMKIGTQLKISKREKPQQLKLRVSIKHTPPVINPIPGGESVTTKKSNLNLLSPPFMSQKENLIISIDQKDVYTYQDAIRKHSQMLCGDVFKSPKPVSVKKPPEQAWEGYKLPEVWRTSNYNSPKINYIKEEISHNEINTSLDDKSKQNPNNLISVKTERRNDNRELSLLL